MLFKNLGRYKMIKNITKEEFNKFWEFLFQKIKNSNRRFKGYKSLKINNFEIFFKKIVNNIYCLCAHKDKSSIFEDVNIAGLNLCILQNELFDIFKNGFNKNEEIDLLKKEYYRSTDIITFLKETQDFSQNDLFLQSNKERRNCLRERNRIINTEQLCRLLEKLYLEKINNKNKIYNN